MIYVKDISEKAIRYLISNRPKYSDFNKTSKKDDELFFNKKYAYEWLLNRFSNLNSQNEIIEVFLHDIESDISLGELFSKQEHNKDRYYVLHDIYDDLIKIL